jgi:hypothetical protein
VVVKEAPGSLFLQFNTAGVGPPGCEIMAEAITPGSGTSKPRSLGTIVRVPRIESFSVSDQRADDNTWLGTLKGHDLDTIQRVGWDPATGVEVSGIPVPAGNGDEETLPVAVPWPAPSPHAPLYVWLRGESAGRLTSAKL